MSFIGRVAVIGAGVMGHGIAQVVATSGFSVSLVDVSEGILARATTSIKGSLEKLYEKGFLKEDPKSVLSRIETTTSLIKAVSGADYVIEAVPENLELKKNVFSQADKWAPPHAILATNTSTLRITEIAEATMRPSKVLGMHFFNPPQLMKLVEIVKGERTGGDVVEVAKELARRMGKEVVICERDLPGFIVNRILFREINEGLWALERGEASEEQVDSSARYSLGLPMGPVELSDFIGLDTVLSILKVLEEGYGRRFSPPPTLKALVEEGNLGRKSGRGFYDWSSGRPSISKDLAGDFDSARLLAVSANEAYWVVEDGVTIEEEVDRAMKLGANWPKGPFRWCQEVGKERVRSLLRDLARRLVEEFFPLVGTPQYFFVKIIKKYLICDCQM